VPNGHDPALEAVVRELRTKAYDGGSLPPSYVFCVFWVACVGPELGSASARGGEDRFALRLFGFCGLKVRFER
jgi:hypothetical protein